MVNNILVVLAYNEELNIENTINSLYDEFDELIIVNDCSKDRTLEIINKFSKDYQKIKIINNEKNFGAGKSLQIVFDYILNNYPEKPNVIKIDGDGQFLREDAIRIKELLEENLTDFVKCNRFWHEGIVGKIPPIRYLGNSLANFLIKLNTGLWKINDPLNGLFGFSFDFLSLIKIPKLFKRYGYPFYINSLSVLYCIQTVEINNTVRYDIGAKSQLKAISLFFKIIIYSIKYFFKNINFKIKESRLQASAILDCFFLLIQFLSFITLYKLFTIRYGGVDGIQSNWLIIFIVIQLFSYLLIYYSKNLENNFRRKLFEYR